MSPAIGQSTDQKVVLRKSDRDTHMQVIGASGMGKSFFLEHLIRNDIKQGHGVCLIDPHGEMYHNLLTWLACSGYRSRQVHLINPPKGDYSVGFNPLAIDREPTRCVFDMMTAFAQIWEGKTIDETPRLAKCLQATLYPLAHHRLSLFESDIFTTTRHKELRQKMVSELPIEEYQSAWAQLESYADKEFNEYFESTHTRLFKFLTSPAIKPIMGQTDNVLDFKACMERGHIVLVNLAESSSFHKSEAKLLGALITAELYSCAKQRDPKWAKSKPFYAVIDECADFLNEDIASSLDETRKFGLHFTLSHQRLEQLRAVSDNFYDAVMANAQAKVVFRPGDDASAAVLSPQLFRTSFDLERPKESLNKPVAVGQELIELFSSSETTSSATASGTSTGDGSGHSSGVSNSTAVSVFSPLDGASPDQTIIDGLGDSASYSSSSFNSYSVSEAEGHSTTFGRSQSLQTVYEIMPTTVYSLEEMIHLGMVAIRELPKREAFVVMPGEKPRRMRTLDVKTYQPMPRQIEHKTMRINEQSEFTKPADQVLRDVAQRKVDVFEQPLDVPDPESFYD